MCNKHRTRFIDSFRNKKKYREIDFYFLYQKIHSNIIRDKVFIPERKLSTFYVFGSEPIIREKKLKVIRFTHFYALVSSIVFRIMRLEKSRVIGTDYVSFLVEYKELVRIFGISLNQCLLEIERLYPFHQFDEGFLILKNICRINDGFFNLKEIKGDMGLVELEGSISKLITEDYIHYYKKLMTKLKQVYKTNETGTRKIEEGIMTIRADNKDAYVIGLKLYLNQADLVTNRYKIKLLINFIFKKIEGFCKGDKKIFYAKNIGFDIEMGVRVNLICVLNFAVCDFIVELNNIFQEQQLDLNECMVELCQFKSMDRPMNYILNNINNYGLYDNSLPYFMKMILSSNTRVFSVGKFHAN